MAALHEMKKHVHVLFSYKNIKRRIKYFQFIHSPLHKYFVLMFFRLKKLQKLLHAILDLDQSTIMEIRGYAKPPPIVHTVMVSTLLLLGHWKDETKVRHDVKRCGV